MAEYWNVDDATTLIRDGKKFSIRWAGAMFGPERKLENLCSGSLLLQCEELLKTPGRKAELVTADTPVGVGQTVLLD